MKSTGFWALASALATLGQALGSPQECADYVFESPLYSIRSRGVRGSGECVGRACLNEDCSEFILYGYCGPCGPCLSGGLDGKIDRWCNGQGYSTNWNEDLEVHRPLILHVHFGARSSGSFRVIADTIQSPTTGGGQSCSPGPYGFEECASWTWYALPPGHYRLEGESSNPSNVPPPRPTIEARPRLTLMVPADFPSPQVAMNFAMDGDEVCVAEGVYSGGIDFKGKAITIKATGSRDNTILEGVNCSGPVVLATSGETPTAVLQGFTIRNGSSGVLVSGQRLGGGMFVHNAGPTVRDCAFVANQAELGGGLAVIQGNPTLEGCVFIQNVAANAGGAVHVLEGSPVLRDCTLMENEARLGAGIAFVPGATGRMTLDGCAVLGNTALDGSGGGVSVGSRPTAGTSVIITECNIRGNRATRKGAGLYAMVDAASPARNIMLHDSVVCGNTSDATMNGNVDALFDGQGNQICDCGGDLDDSGEVDSADLAAILIGFGSVTPADHLRIDPDMNGWVDGADIAEVLLRYGPCPTASLVGAPVFEFELDLHDSLKAIRDRLIINRSSQ